jgi:DNA polymerase-3 subunit gamma/tau
MSYLVLARKYRPQTFDQVVKQEHVTRTLVNAISSGRVAHAILFSGPRGTGKTTVARVLAKAMNCKQGPTPTPCNECRSCKEITSGNAADVFEIDGASNNGVDQIRELRENIKYLPAHSSYKIYIIDEVHMLSIAAFNALLKTLEEPPPHVMFLFATTEPHKIPITILSRCQRHDLRRISIESVSKHLAWLCQQEHIEIAEESLNLIARESGGSMRDALSLLDQVITCAEGAITHEQILDILGIIDRAILFDISSAIFKGEVSKILDILTEIYDHGHNLKELYSDLIEHFRNLLVVKMGKKVNKLVDVPAHETALMAEQIRSVSEIYLTRVLDILFKEESAVQFSSQPKLALEMVFIRMFQSKPVLPIDVLIEKIDSLKKGVYEPSPNAAEIRDAENGWNTPERRETPKPARISHDDAEIKSTPYMPPEPITPPLPSAQAHAPAFNPDDSLDEIWAKLLNAISKASPSLGAILPKCSLSAVSGEKLEIEVSGNGFFVERINKNESLIRKVCDAFFGKKMELVIKAKTNPQAQEDFREKKSREETLKDEAVKNPLVTAALEIFGGRVVNVRVL